MSASNIYNSAAHGIVFQKPEDSRNIERRQKHLLLNKYQKDYQPYSSDRILFSRTPRLNLKNVFDKAVAYLPAEANISFLRNGDTPYPSNGVVVEPLSSFNKKDGFLQSDPPYLAWRHHPDLKSVHITRIQAGNKKGTGLGKAMILSQLPLWNELGIERVVVIAHEGSEGFYKNMGFEPVDTISERGFAKRPMFKPLALDMNNEQQKQSFLNSLKRGYARHQSLTGKTPLHINLPHVKLDI